MVLQTATRKQILRERITWPRSKTQMPAEDGFTVLPKLAFIRMIAQGEHLEKLLAIPSRHVPTALWFPSPMLDALARVRGQVYVNSIGGCYVGQSIVTTYAGNGQQGFQDGSSSKAEFSYPKNEAMDASGNLYVLDGPDDNSTMIRKITPEGIVSTLAGSTETGYQDGNGTAARFYNITGITLDAAGNIYVTDAYNYMIRKITSDGMVSTIAGAVPRQSGFRDGQGTTAGFIFPTDIAVDGDGNLYIMDVSRLRKITPDGIVSTYAGNGTRGYLDGPIGSAEFYGAGGTITIDKSGIIYVYESGRIRKISNGIVSTLAGDGSNNFADGVGTSAKLGWINQITIGADGNLYWTDGNENCIRKLTPAGIVTTITRHSTYRDYVNGSLSNAYFGYPIATDTFGNIYFSDGLINNVVRKITPPF